MLCGVCQKEKFRYTCPRCEVLYCSLQCYQGHNGKCVESFYKSQVDAVLKSDRADEGERRKLENIVYKMSRLDAGDSDSEEESNAREVDPDDEGGGLDEERLLRLVEKAEKGELCLDDLTEAEVKMFHSELKRGALSQSLKPWEPWWDKAAVVELETLDSIDGLDECGGGSCEGGRALSSTASAQAMPPHICCGPSSSPGERPANPAVVWTLVEAVYAYVHTMLAFNGDCHWDSLQAAVNLLQLAPGICSGKRVFGSAEECLAASLAAAAALPGGGFGRALDLQAAGAASKVLLGRGMVVGRAVHETVELVQAAIAAAKAQERSSPAARMSRGLKKLEFLHSFAHHHDDDVAMAGAEVRLFADARSQELRVIETEHERRKGGGIVLPPRHSDESELLA
eukprot:TRINITY_DN36309_c0_g1_i1.p1 TRINITY_DN36309_c0_g1~~TRINITY_DN36309_c0_g1_i1.p1  ORF type:complete len:398 (-),score=112.59 TRINITY_DN36309_c0_g1_i1:136-1329(-)